ncbi:hypothetical protein [Streptomyces clavuligerus]|uniref:hypothetical protein n=1 Tax=Streptomyces clavuligerus TaxID=1901 RepID=UPI00020D92CC|nr:hypothetical protein [Streptomyces clavuligerus]WDN56027.1 hypothetical protein LL058_29525 [Streptomyces clavuligerus]
MIPARVRGRHRRPPRPRPAVAAWRRVKTLVWRAALGAAYSAGGAAVSLVLTRFLTGG